MQKKIIICTLALYMLMSGIAFANENAPESIAGITIGKKIDSIRSLLNMKSESSSWQQGYIKRIEIRDMEGYRGGYVEIGTCNRVDTILRMKLKYEDGSSNFFNQLYGKMEKRFGKPNDWRGNPFGTLKIWKWSLKDSKGNVSLILQHFSGEDDSITKGNSIRLSRPEWINEEKNCWKITHPQVKETPIPAKMEGMKWFLPY